MKIRIYGVLRVEVVMRMSAEHDYLAVLAQDLLELAVLEYAASHAPAHNAFAKSGLMLGLGESRAEIRQTLVDLHNVGVEMVTLGQYLRPGHRNWPVARYVTPDEFDEWRQIAEQEIGFRRAVSGPFVRSSYMAEEAFMKSMGTSE